MTDRTATSAGDLARRGFSDTTRAAAALESVLDAHPEAVDLVDQLAAAADQDLALAALADLQRNAPLLLDEVFADLGWLNRLVAVLGGSNALAQWLRAFPEDARVLAANPLERAAPHGAAEPSLSDRVMGVLSTPAPADELRRANRRELLRIAGRDLTSTNPFALVDTVAAALADLADVVMEAAYRIACAQVKGADKVRLAIIALGKCGARELNYISDIDVLYVAEPAGPVPPTSDEALAIGERLARVIAQVCGGMSAAGSIWQVDAGLRPEGNSGPLVRTLESMRAYYTKWASNWEFQAMLKARPMAGDLELGQAFVDMVSPLVWQAGERPDFVAESQAMRARVISLLPATEADRELKLSAGGLRDVEFSAQILQLVHGRADERLRLPATLPALAALAGAGYIGREDGDRLAQAYRFLRVSEHRAQLWQLRRTHLMPLDVTARAKLAKSLGLSSGEELWQRWRDTATQVRTLQQRVFYSPILDAVAHVKSDALRLSSDTAAARLRSLGFADTAAALRHIEALTAGVSRSAQIQRQLLPAMLGWLAAGPNPDAGLLAFRHLSEDVGRTDWYLRTLRDTGLVAERLAKLLASSRYA
ncbi:MAG: bifunctional [glutamine synthetase] adenylyltransferase/[glutamine synthetase]-adenylyl-L-tyrosine phosphorylase, partial [Propionibacteriaceae bacterium]|nr:bifunctional [glutamine synthetase] adenylyltransferase/[glutamine synthetase]-adenylyl-L-tyrosine phosphorylase [Propionibacteriaceae bacterium]